MATKISWLVKHVSEKENTNADAQELPVFPKKKIK